MNPLEALIIGTAIIAGTPDKPAVEYDASATCLAKNMYYEARNQGTAGWMDLSRRLFLIV